MSRRTKIAVIAGFVLLAVLVMTSLFPPLRMASGFDRLSTSEMRRAERMFEEAVASPSEASWQQPARSSGFQIDRHSDFTALTETEGDCRGRGIYLLRNQGASSPVAVTAPHRGSDRHTGTLAEMLFREGGLAAAGWNSAPRRKSAECSAHGDLAKARRHFFTAFTTGFAQVYPQGRVVQLHGFDRQRRSSGAGRAADFIVSDGTDRPGDRLLALSECLTFALPEWNVRVYPLDAAELGGLSNVQGEALREIGFAGFVHVEISLAARRALLEKEDMRRHFVQCLMA
ncbi:hypothetical protein GRI38_12425 [Altererythrobacter aurantiacus]|uniref:Uncharacterized protein n=1 Tax=Parapontixanthobacter aurantiacus TaxID=1463599 RepID=A0A844ZHW0_9SPHN|nr:hypothetical protein [Parapontixanthobacter aurantiacus]MXO86832.1 hypothetical protein [Parapontixanthobacter aurantiacus]